MKLIESNSIYDLLGREDHDARTRVDVMLGEHYNGNVVMSNTHNCWMVEIVPGRWSRVVRHGQQFIVSRKFYVANKAPAALLEMELEQAITELESLHARAALQQSRIDDLRMAIASVS